jgi:energy-coupling factor transport system ATP-binding protein
MREPGGSGTDAPTAIHFQGFSCRYGPALPLVLEDVDLRIEPGECVFVLGAGGAGKTTLGLAIAGVIPHVRGRTRGSVSIFGQPTTRSTLPQLAQRVGIVFQDVESQLCMLRVRDEVAFGPENFQVERQEILRRVDEALDFVGLGGMHDRAVFELSGGEKQKVALAAVLAGRPDILFLDEPAANLDPRSTAEIVDIVRRLKARHTIIVFENKVDDFLPEADRLVVLHKGHVVLDGSPRTILAEHGQRLMDEFGVWIPQPSALALQLAPTVRPFPLTVEEAAPVLAPVLPPRASDANHRLATPPSHADAAPVAEVSGISYRYDPQRAPALEDISLRIGEGEWLALVGPNGSGKTTLAKHLIGLLKPQTGSVAILGQDTRAASIRELARLVGYVFQNPEHQFVADTVEDELFFSLRAAGAAEDMLADRVRESIAHFDLAGLERRHPYSLSGGEKRRLSVATMLITRPRLLILDEPTYGLDRRSTQQVMRAVEAAATSRADGRATTLVMVTHDMRLVADYASSAAVMSGGHLVYRGSVDGLFDDEDLLARCSLDVPPFARLDHLLGPTGKMLPRAAALAAVG